MSIHGHASWMDTQSLLKYFILALTVQRWSYMGGGGDTLAGIPILVPPGWPQLGVDTLGSLLTIIF